MEVGSGRPSGGTGEGDHIPGLHRLTYPRQQLGAVAVQGGESAAVVDHHIVAVAAPVIGRHGHGPRQGGADGGSGGYRQIYPRVAPPLAGEGVAAVAKLRGDHVPPALSDGGAEAVRPDEGHIRTGEAAAASRRTVSDQVVDTVSVALLFGGGRHTHGGDVLPNGVQVFNGNGCGVVLLRLSGRVAALYGDGAGALLVGDEAVRKGLCVSVRFGAEVQSIKNRLDADVVKTVSFFCILVDGGDGSVQLTETGAHGLNADPIFLRSIRWDGDGIVEAQLYGGDVVLRGARAQRA